MSRLEHGARVVEYTVATVLTLGIVALHFNFLGHAGPLWRDEISSLSLATQPTLAGAWSALVYDPVPMLFFCLLRFWNFLAGAGGDQNLRWLGLAIGLGVVAALWVASLLLKKSPPTWALLIFGLSPVTIVWGDSLRAYGLSCFFNILVIALLWCLLTAEPRPRDVALAGLAAILSVHSLFPNALLLFAAGSSAIVIALSRRWWRSAVAIGGVGFVAALSLLPYIPTILRTQEWSKICQTGSDSGWIVTMLHRALSSGGQLSAGIWIALAVVVGSAFLLALVRPKWLGVEPPARSLVLYLGATLFIASFAIIAFFRVVGWTTSLWYYLPLMGTAAVCLDAAARSWDKYPVVRGGSALFVATVAALGAPLLGQASSVRLTNADLTARAVAQVAGPDDLVVVDNFFYSVSFHRYYNGAAPCLGVPRVADLSLHRWDLLKAQMIQAQPIKPVLDRIEQTLRAGHSVFVVGFAPLNRAASPPPDLPAAPHSSAQWRAGAYIIRWTMQVAYAAQSHAEHGVVVPVRCAQPVSEAENIRAVAISGWQEKEVAEHP